MADVADGASLLFRLFFFLPLQPPRFVLLVSFSCAIFTVEYEVCSTE